MHSDTLFGSHEALQEIEEAISAAEEAHDDGLSTLEQRVAFDNDMVGSRKIAARQRMLLIERWMDEWPDTKRVLRENRRAILATVADTVAVSARDSAAKVLRLANRSAAAFYYEVAAQHELSRVDGASRLGRGAIAEGRLWWAQSKVNRAMEAIGRVLRSPDGTPPS